MVWDEIVRKVSPYVVRVETQGGHGTGFLCLYNEDRSLCGIATALHVVYYADDWQQPIRIRHEESTKVRRLTETERFIFKDFKTDSAVILFAKSDFPLPDEPIPLLPTAERISIGVEVGWLGFPAIDPYTLCFFSGNVSAWREDRRAYLIDGVAINGVSGGPVLFHTGVIDPRIVGIITAYQASRAGGEALPGLSIAQDVSHFHDVIGHVRSIDEAKKKDELAKSGQPNSGKQPRPPEPPAPASTTGASCYLA